METTFDNLWPLIVKLVAATVCGGLIGLEREIHGRPAGLRTNALVCLASCLLIIVSRTGALFGMDRSADFMLNVDPARMAAGIVTGIGFLGAGAILRVKDSLIRGLTTAAGIWFVAAVGVSIGLNAYVLAGAATIIALLVLGVLSRVERSIHEVAYRTLIVRVESDFLTDLETRAKALITERRMVVKQTAYQIDNDTGATEITLVVRTQKSFATLELVRELSRVQGVKSVIWK
jgi:putative Mg2+ transporter-C (MgtC) family protein